MLFRYRGNYDTLDGMACRILEIIKQILRSLIPLTNKRTNFDFIDISHGGDTWQRDLAELMKLVMGETIQVPIKAVRHFDTESIRDAHRGWARLHGLGSMLVQIGKQQH